MASVDMEEDEERTRYNRNGTGQGASAVEVRVVAGPLRVKEQLARRAVARGEPGARPHHRLGRRQRRRRAAGGAPDRHGAAGLVGLGDDAARVGSEALYEGVCARMCVWRRGGVTA